MSNKRGTPGDESAAALQVMMDWPGRQSRRYEGCQRSPGSQLDEHLLLSCQCPHLQAVTSWCHQLQKPPAIAARFDMHTYHSHAYDYACSPT